LTWEPRNPHPRGQKTLPTTLEKLGVPRMAKTQPQTAIQKNVVLGFAEVYKYMLHFPFRVPQFPSEEESRCY
jgi:hypothetical protein